LDNAFDGTHLTDTWCKSDFHKISESYANIVKDMTCILWIPVTFIQDFFSHGYYL